jgi:hypothetical protein
MELQIHRVWPPLHKPLLLLVEHVQAVSITHRGPVMLRVRQAAVAVLSLSPISLANVSRHSHRTMTSSEPAGAWPEWSRCSRHKVGKWLPLAEIARILIFTTWPLAPPLSTARVGLGSAPAGHQHLAKSAKRHCKQKHYIDIGCRYGAQ